MWCGLTHSWRKASNARAGEEWEDCIHQRCSSNRPVLHGSDDGIKSVSSRSGEEMLEYGDWRRGLSGSWYQRVQAVVAGSKEGHHSKRAWCRRVVQLTAERKREAMKEPEGKEQGPHSVLRITSRHARLPSSFVPRLLPDTAPLFQP